jgi:hypothetical protein
MERTVFRSPRDARENLTALEKDSTVGLMIGRPDREEIVVGRRRLADEVDVGFHGDDTAIVAHVEELFDGFAAVVAVVESALVDVHADEAVGHGGVEIASELHGVFEGSFAVVKGVLDTVAQGVGGNELNFRA